MPRIRTLKPEMLKDEKLAPMCVLDRFVFTGLIIIADDAGRIVDNLKSIDGDIFPETEDTAREALTRLAAAGRILRYVSTSGQKLIQITGWARHQKVDHPSKYTLPAPPGEPAATPSPEPETPIEPRRDTLAEPSREPRESRATVSRLDLRPTTLDLRPGTVEQELARGAGPAAPPAPAPSLRVVDGGQARRERVASVVGSLDGPALADAYTLVADALEPIDGRDLLLDVLRAAPEDEDATRYLRVMADALAPLGGGARTSPAQLRAAVADWLTTAENPSLRLFRGYLRNARHAPPPTGSPPRTAAGATSGRETDAERAERSARVARRVAEREAAAAAERQRAGDRRVADPQPAPDRNSPRTPAPARIGTLGVLTEFLDAPAGKAAASA